MQNGLSVVAYNLADVGPMDGGFGCVPGSHKSNYQFPSDWREMEELNPIVQRVTGPAGTAIIFTEALTHSPTTWKSEKYDRVPVFNCYNTVNSKWHNWNPHPDHVAEMPTKRQTLFRPVHVAGNVIGGAYRD